jgi:hypothetical protein
MCATRLMRMRIHHSVFTVALVAAGGAGCAARYECLTSHPAPLASQSASIRIVRRELSRAEGGSPALRGRIEKELPALLPDLSARIDAPTCGPDLVDRLAEDLQERPLPYGRDVFDEAEALGRTVDTVDVMGAKAKVLLRLATIPDADLEPYRFAAGEQGPAPPPARLRYLALRLLVHSSLFLNVSEVRRS